MTYLVDISTHQRGIDIGAIRRAGNPALGVKSVAANTAKLAEAADYRDHIDAAMREGMPKFHYAVPNSVNTPAETARFQMGVVYRRQAWDCFMLDNEPLDQYPVFWTDDNAAAYFEELHRLGVDYPNMWLYCPAARTRAAGAWPKINALIDKGLKIVWVSYGDNDPLLEDGEEPYLGTAPGRIKTWHLHQFTSSYMIPEWPRGLDRNYSPLTIAELFGEDSMTAGYSNVNRFIVILADNRDPYVSWQNHLARGSAGGVDCVAQIGTPIYAPADCVLANTPNNGTGGNTITLSFADGWRDQMMHLSQFVTPGVKRRGEVVGYSGDSGSPGQPHVHWHRVDPQGRRQNPWNYFSSTPASGGVTPIPNGDTLMALKNSMEILFSPRLGYLLTGPSHCYEIANQDGVDGGKKLAFFRDKLGIPQTEVTDEQWNIARITLLGNRLDSASAEYTASLVKVGLTDAQLDSLAAKVAASIPAGGPSADAIATAVREKLRTDPLK